MDGGESTRHQGVRPEFDENVPEGRVVCVRAQCRHWSVRRYTCGLSCLKASDVVLAEKQYTDKHPYTQKAK